MRGPGRRAPRSRGRGRTARVVHARAEVAPLAPASKPAAAQPLDRTVFVRVTGTAAAAGAPQRAAHAFRRVSSMRLEPGGECLVEQPLGLPLGQHAEQRIDARFDRPLAQQVGAEAVNRADVRFLEILHGARRAARRRRRSAAFAAPSRAAARSRSFSSPAAFSVNVTATISRDVGAPVGEHAHDPFDQLRRLAGARRGLDDQRLVEGVCDEPPRVVVGAVTTVVMAGSSARARSASDPAACARRGCTTSGPHTGRKSHRSQASSVGAAARKPRSIARSMTSQHLEARRARHARSSGIGCE